MGVGGSDYHYKCNLGVWLYSLRKFKTGNCKFDVEKEAQLQILIDKGFIINIKYTYIYILL
jgi:hypothetical protein